MEWCNLHSMPRKANSGSFQPGHKRSQESIEKQRATLRARGSHPTNPWTDASKAKLRSTVRAQSLGHRRMQNGYWQIMTEDGYHYEHRIVMEGMLHRPLTHDDVVHHVNHDKLDNRPENLMLTSWAEHHTHAVHPSPFPNPGWRKLPPGKWSLKHARCIDCGQTTYYHVAHGRCSQCHYRWYQRPSRRA